MATPRAKPARLGHQGKQKASEVCMSCHFYELIDLNEACSAAQLKAFCQGTQKLF